MSSEHGRGRRSVLRCAVSEVEPGAMDRDRVEAILRQKLPSHPDVRRGTLPSGMKYVVLRNCMPPERFEAHLEMHVGSYDEEDDEQGLAHLVEHVTFLGSRKRRQLIGTGSESNAYTDFHHTVYHIHSPVESPQIGELLPVALNALSEVAFTPELLSQRIEKERRAVLSELQMQNNMEYRVETKLLEQLHIENKLGRRFPIGKEEQIRTWEHDHLRNFHANHYTPSNSTLFVVGDVDVEDTVELIEDVFGDLLIERSHVPRIPMSHIYDRPPFSVKPHIYQHELVQQFSLTSLLKSPIVSVLDLGGLRDILMVRIVLSALQFRINAIYQGDAEPPFSLIGLDHYDSSREDCAVTSLTVQSEARDWRAALEIGVREVQRIIEYGITQNELDRYLAAFLKDSALLAEQRDSVPSLDHLEFIMENDAIGHTVMDQEQAHQALLDTAATVTLNDVNESASELLTRLLEQPSATFVCAPTRLPGGGPMDSDFTSEGISAVMESARQNVSPPDDVEVPNSLLSDSELERILAEGRPAFVPFEEEPGMPLLREDAHTGIRQRRLANGLRVNYRQTTNEAKQCAVRLSALGGRGVHNGKGAAVALGVRTLLEGGSVGGFTREQVEQFCIEHLITCDLDADEEAVRIDFRFSVRDDGMQRAFELMHFFVREPHWDEMAFRRAQRSYTAHFEGLGKDLERATQNKLIRSLVADDGRFHDPTPDQVNSLDMGAVIEAVEEQLRTDNLEVSIVGDFDVDELENCVLRYLGTVPDSGSAGGPEARAKALGNIPPLPILDPPANNIMRIHLQDSDERALAYIGGSTIGRWEYSPRTNDEVATELAASTAAQAESRTRESTGTGRLMSGGDDYANLLQFIPMMIDKAFYVNLLREGSESDEATLARRSHPIYSAAAMGVMTELLNSRLFKEVRDALGLTYSVSLELCLYDWLKPGLYMMSLNSTPGKIDKTVAAAIRVLRGLVFQPVTESEVEQARKSLLTKHESSLRENAYWLDLMTHVQAAGVPRKDISSIREVSSVYNSIQVSDIYDVYSFLEIGDESIRVAIGTTGPEAHADAEIGAF